MDYLVIGLLSLEVGGLFVFGGFRFSVVFFPHLNRAFFVCFLCLRTTAPMQ